MTAGVFCCGRRVLVMNDKALKILVECTSFLLFFALENFERLN